ncbi:MAG: hypothetical protein ACRDSJ_22810, partial [Rubrobacteraceae bacterium]
LEGVRLLSDTQRVAVRLDAEGVEENGHCPGKPLRECVEVVDERYAGSVERLLGGIFVVEDAEANHLANGHVAVTLDGIRLTRTSVSRANSNGSFAREAKLASGLKLLDELESGPDGMLRELQNGLAHLSTRLGSTSATSRSLGSIAGRTRRLHQTLVRESRRKLAAATKAREASNRRADDLSRLKLEAEERRSSLSREEMKEAQRALSSAVAASDAAQSAVEESDRERKRLRAALSEGEKREASISSRLERARSLSEEEESRLVQLAARTRFVSERLSEACGERRNALRLARAEKTENYRRSSSRQNALARDAAELGAEIAAARARVESLEETLRRTADSASEASEEIREEWSATLEDARRQAEKHSEDTDHERHKLARKLKRFGDVNLLSLSQETEMRERYETMFSQRKDAEEATHELQRIIHSIDSEIESRFSETFGKVEKTFSEMVPRMMEGAAGSLELSEEGVEIGLRLGRRGWRSLTVLSGGERSLLALSFLFSILLSRGVSAKTFCILDEAEAALDDVNLARFISVVDSQRANGQFILVTHQKRTMAAADVLYGAIQDASGATLVVSKRIQGE